MIEYQQQKPHLNIKNRRKISLNSEEMIRLPSGSKLATGRLFGPVAVCALRRPLEIKQKLKR